MTQRFRTIYLLRQSQLASYAKLEAALGSFELTPTQYTVLSLSRGAAVAPSSAELARLAGVTAQAMNEIIGVLERKALIQRRESEENRRVLRISLTDVGRRLLKACDAAVDQVESDLLQALAPAEIEVLRSLLARVVNGRVVVGRG